MSDRDLLREVKDTLRVILEYASPAVADESVDWKNCCAWVTRYAKEITARLDAALSQPDATEKGNS